ncbi:unnamed protein product [Caenorhabditis brenneri]
MVSVATGYGNQGKLYLESPNSSKRCPSIGGVHFSFHKDYGTLILAAKDYGTHGLGHLRYASQLVCHCIEGRQQYLSRVTWYLGHPAVLLYQRDPAQQPFWPVPYL